MIIVYDCMLYFILKSNGNCVLRDKNGMLSNIGPVSNVPRVTRQSRREIICSVRGILTKDYLESFIHGNDICIYERICQLSDPGYACIVLWCICETHLHRWDYDAIM